MHSRLSRASDPLWQPAVKSDCYGDLRVLKCSWGIISSRDNQQQNCQGQKLELLPHIWNKFSFPPGFVYYRNYWVDMLWTSYSFSDIMGFPLLIGHLDSESRASKSAIAIPSWSLDYGCLGYAALTPIWQYLEMWLWNVIMCMFSHVQLFATPWTVAYQTLLSMGFSRQEYWSGFHFLLQGIFPIQGSNYISYVSCIGR